MNNINQKFKLVTFVGKKISFFLIILFVFLSQCGIYKYSDSRKVSGNAKERVKQNMEQGKGISFGQVGKRSGEFDFASSNEMWRATLEIVDFMPLTSADYGGGIIITDWYSDNTEDNSSIKIMVRFLSNEVRADGIEVTVYKKNCKSLQDSGSCSTSVQNDMSNEIKLAILKKAALFKNNKIEKNKKEFNKRNSGKIF